MNSSSGSPDSPKVSLVPILVTGQGMFSERNSETAEPSPPITLCSSAVTAHPVLETDVTIACVSRGLIVDMSMTSAVMPSFSSMSAASMQRATIWPVPMRVTSVPVRRTLAFPISNFTSSGKSTGTSARPSLM